VDFVFQITQTCGTNADTVQTHARKPNKSIEFTFIFCNLHKYKNSQMITGIHVAAIEEINTSVACIQFRNDGITKIVIKNEVEIKLKDSKEIFETLKARFTGEKYLVLVIAGEDATATKEAREFSSTDLASSITIAEAIVIKSIAQKLLVNFTIKFFKPKRAMKMFINEEEALQWLYSFKIN